MNDPLTRSAGFLLALHESGMLGLWHRFYFPGLHEMTDRRMREGWTWPAGYSGYRDESGARILAGPDEKLR